MIMVFESIAVISRGQLIDLQIEAAAYQGRAVARRDDFVVFVKNAVPGDRVRARVIKKKRRYAEAVVEEMIAASPYRVDPRCRYFGTCGGCSWQNTDYEQQLAFKKVQVEEILKHLGGVEFKAVRSTLPSPRTYYYRNKMEFTFGSRRWLTKEEISSGEVIDKDFALGLHIPKRWDRILDLEVCYLQSDLSAQIVNQVRQLALSEKWSAFDSRNHTGYLRNLVLRTGLRTAEVMVNLVTSRSEPQRMRLLTDRLLEAVPSITTIVNTINLTPSPGAEASDAMVYHGKGTIAERLGDLVLVIAPDTFFQPNPAQAERLCEVVRNFADLEGDETVYDLYSGSGLLALFLAPGVAKVVGIESQQRAVDAAVGNASANGIGNCVFCFGDVGETLSDDLIARNGRPDVLVTDPPRAGMPKKVCHSILRFAPRRVVYVSCNPTTQARDLKILSSGYAIADVQPLDMFPHTYHIENVVVLDRV